MIPQHYPIEAGKLYGGEYPGDRNPEVAKTRLRCLVNIGIRTFVDLTAPADGMVPYDSLLTGLEQETGTTLRRRISSGTGRTDAERRQPTSTSPTMELLLNEDIYRRVIVELLPQTRKFLWIVTADIKDLHVPKGHRFVPLLEILSDLIGEGVAIRLMHAKEPGSCTCFRPPAPAPHS